MSKTKLLAAACVSCLLMLAPFTTATANERDVTDGAAMLITSGHPNDPTYANAGDNLRTGVGSIFVQFASTEPLGYGFLCTASAIGDRHVLTAAHCLRNTDPDGNPDPLTRIVVIFPSGVSYLFFSEDGEVSGFAVHPWYDLTNPSYGAFALGDMAVIEMAADLPADVERYDLYTTGDEFGQETRHYGHGSFGKGNKGAVGGSDFFYARTGLNMYEQTMEPFFGSPFDQLLHDFDSGGIKHNAMEWWFTSRFACAPEHPDNPAWAQDGQCTTFKDGSYPDFKGFGTLEVGIGPGDSGGPGFIDGKIAGVHSFGFTHFCTGVTNGTDFSCGLNSSYGEMSGDTRVSSYVSWIEYVAAGNDINPVPEEPAMAEQASAATAVELSERAQALIGNSFARQLRAPLRLAEFEKRFGLD